MIARRWTNAVLLTFAVVSLVIFIVTTVHELGQTPFDDAYMFTRYYWLAGAGLLLEYR